MIKINSQSKRERSSLANRRWVRCRALLVNWTERARQILRRSTRPMIAIKAEQEHYCLATDGESWTVIERRAGKYYPLGNCSGPGVALDEQNAATLFRE